MATKTTRRNKTKKPTPLSTHALAAFLTWKQFDILLLLREAPSTVAILSDEITQIKDYDTKHGGAFYNGVSWQSTYSCLRTMFKRRLVDSYIADNGTTEWSLTDRGHKLLNGLDD